MSELHFVVFDCDGTLVDSQHMIHAAMHTGFGAVGRDEPSLGDVRRVIGLSLHEAITRLAPELSAAERGTIEHAYKEAFAAQRQAAPHEPLFPGARELIHLLRDTGYLLGIATGKSWRGLKATLQQHDLLDLFDSLQTADQGPGKPNPAMLQAAMADVGAEPGKTILIGDTTFDILMARAAGAHALGVSWGFHPPEELVQAGAHAMIDSFEEAPSTIRKILGGPPQ